MNQKEDEIRCMAYLMWEQEGRPAGREVVHWLKAEQTWEAKQRNATASAPVVASGIKVSQPGRPAKRRRSSSR